MGGAYLPGNVTSSSSKTLASKYWSVGQHLWEIGPFKDVAESKRAFEQLQTENHIRYDDLPLEARDGRRVQVEFVSNVYQVDGQRVIQCNVRDITARHRAETALHVSEGRYHSLVEQASDGIFVADATGEYIDVNSAGCALLGYTREEILQRSMVDLVNPDELAVSPFKLSDMQAGQAVLNERHMRRKDGSLVPVEISGRLLPDGRLLGLVRDITERKQAEQEIESLARFPAENPNPVLRVGSDGTLLYANEASHVILQDWGCAVGERVPAFWQSVVAAALAEQSNQHLDIQLADRVWSFFMTPVVEAGYLNLYGRDITERKQAEDALRESEDKFKYVFDYSVVGKSITQFDGGMQVNRALCSMLGYSVEEMLSQKWQDITHPADIELTQNQIDSLLSGEKDSVRFVKRFIHKNGSVVWVDLSSSIRRNQQHQPLYLMSAVVDITERKQAEDEVHQLNAELEQRVEARTAQLEAANKELEAFSYSISHDLRAPLRAMDGFSRILLEDYGPQLDAEAQRFLKIVCDNAQQMGHLIDDLLAFSRLSRQPVNKQLVDMNELVSRVVDDVRGDQPARSVELICGDLPPVQGDPILLKQVWINLLSNAFKFTLKCEAARIEIGCQVDQDQPIYFVRDNGAGFDMRYAEKLFGVFQRLHRAQDYEGTGVGLAIVRRIVDRHGGRIWAEAQQDQGATFYFTLNPA